MKKDYLIAIDLDGTVITGFDNYDKKSFALLKELSESNKIIIATGRPYRSSKYYHNLLGLNTPLINYNGALIHNPLDDKFPKYMITIPRNTLFEIIDKNRDILINLFCEVEDDIYLWKNDDLIKPYLHLDGGNLHVGELCEILPTDSNGAIAISCKGSEVRLQKFIDDNYKDILKIRFWDNDQFVISEIYNPSATKGFGLKLIADYYKIPKEKIIAIGDGHNDIELLQEAGISVAMENSHPDLLQTTKNITKTVQENGVYHFLYEFFKK
ncbi:MAG: HAD family hydrolase [Bacilli bacterium]|nr:HAD family hydrolase [Bacilli bacterium]